ncbi:MAG TPA: ATP-binding protein [Treponema sp.]|nr:ATP-binding protein [Treponema sp.]HRS04897.1 ATP-binding protein [Treponema sp.]
MGLASFFRNLITSGKNFEDNDPEKMEMTIRYVLLNSMIFVGCILLVLFGIQSFRAQVYLQGIIDFSMAAITLVGFVLLRTSASFLWASGLTVISFMGLCGFLVYTGGVQNSGVLWAYAFPLLSIFLLGIRFGSILTSIFGLFLGAVVLIPGFSPQTYERAFAFRSIGVYLLVTLCTVVYEVTKMHKDKRLLQLTASLRAERDQIAAMKDNLQEALFLLDPAGIIQDQYSPILETMLGKTNLTGTAFLDLLSGSLTSKERDLLKDFFTMVIEQRFDPAMLEEINPLKEFTYLVPGVSKEKTLSATCSRLQREEGRVFLLCTLRDLTREVELRKQIEEEERKRQQEMRALFEVVHVEPRIFEDFIQELDSQFTTINTALKDTNQDNQNILVTIYQSVHAIKANAVILGLSDFSEKLHQLEGEIKRIQDKRLPDFQDMLHLTLEIEKIYRERDTFQELLERIRSFSKSSGQLQEEQVLIQTLERTIERLSRDLGKHANLSVKKLDSVALSQLDFRLLKEVLVQLVRNALVHGIESPEERQQKGKPPAGTIFLHLEQQGSHWCCIVGDDGKGLCFDRIRERAQHLGISLSPEKERQQLLQCIFSPGFSTQDDADLHGGRGVGLSLVRDRIQKAGGTIKVSTDEGRGCKFYLYLPLQQKDSMAAG